MPELSDNDALQRESQRMRAALAELGGLLRPRSRPADPAPAPLIPAPAIPAPAIPAPERPARRTELPPDAGVIGDNRPAVSSFFTGFDWQIPDELPPATPTAATPTAATPTAATPTAATPTAATPTAPVSVSVSAPAPVSAPPASPPKPIASAKPAAASDSSASKPPAPSEPSARKSSPPSAADGFLAQFDLDNVELPPLTGSEPPGSEPPGSGSGPATVGQFDWGSTA